MKNVKLAKLIEKATLVGHKCLEPFVEEEILMMWKPVHLCLWYNEQNLAIPKYFIGKVSIPSITTASGTNITSIACTMYGACTATGNENPNSWGFCYMTGTSGDPTTANSTVVDYGSLGVQSFFLNLTGLTSGVGYRVRAYAINSAGTGYGTTLQINIPNPPSVALNSPANGGETADTTPDLKFTGTSNSGAEIEYEIQIDPQSDFLSVPFSDNIKYVDVWAYKVGLPVDNITLRIRSGSMTGTVLGTSDNFSVSQINGGILPYKVRFTFATPVSITKGTKYYLEISRSGTRNEGSYVYGAENTDIYSGGGHYTLDNGTWSSEETVRDWVMRVIDSNGVIIVDNPRYRSGNSWMLYGPTGTFEKAGQSFTVPTGSYVCLLDKISSAFDYRTSGTVSNFTGTGSPHPWPSASEVTFTVPSALSPNTYYWRVRGQDEPLVWGSWSDVRTFVITGGGASLTTNNATHAHTADEVQLTQTLNLSINDATHAHTADNVTVQEITAGTVTPADATHLHTADQVPLTQIQNLATDNSTHDHTSSNITLSVSGEVTSQVAKVSSVLQVDIGKIIGVPNASVQKIAGVPNTS